MTSCGRLPELPAQLRRASRHDPGVRRAPQRARDPLPTAHEMDTDLASCELAAPVAD